LLIGLAQALIGSGELGDAAQRAQQQMRFLKDAAILCGVLGWRWTD
jgi:hypothetical protein